MKSAIKVEIFNKNNHIEQKAKITPFLVKNEKRNKLTPEIGLWKAVIMQSVLDMMSSSKRTEEVLAKNSAKLWLNKRNANFLTVCHYADLNPDWVLKKVIFALDNPRTWRRECDLKKYFLNKEA